MAQPNPIELTLHQQSRVLEIAFDDGQRFRLPYELMRVFSPSAEVRGHGPGQETLQTGKREVEITDLEPVGAYGIKPTFSDGHETGIYTWAFLHELGREQARYWRDYEVALAAAGVERDRPMPLPASGHACGHHH
ncbi:MAG: hypothetical protein RL722_606 [Pseudomonadota bacterium]